MEIRKVKEEECKEKLKKENIKMGGNKWKNGRRDEVKKWIKLIIKKRRVIKIKRKEFIGR